MKKLLFIALYVVSAHNHAASEAECAGWLCLPNGFTVPECQEPKSAMESRIRNGEPPLPPIRECGGSGVEATYSVSAYIPAHRVCVEWDGSDMFNAMNCLQWRDVKEVHVRGTYCHQYEDYSTPRGCVRTDVQINMYAEGQEFEGSPYFMSAW
ncbi:MAG: hypothetical protein KZQ97_13860 [Candidatus Thiodiazotropha sp. (ex Dulcina madagascariensis)]|nr:hypothetical protein [Candidatus Thiodiazotropha sp. (ex Dulcina madagascariensis)]